MICPSCDGEKQVFAFVHRTTGCNAGYFDCYRCKGSGSVPDEMAEWIRLGKLIRQARQARDESLYEAAKRLGMKSSELSAIEVGRVCPPQELLS